MRKEKSFTLIELLVVIAIISLLTSIILVSLKSARERAQIGKSLAFSGHIQRSLGAYAVAAYNFNDGTAVDSSGNGNDGATNGPPTQVNSIPELGKDLYFDGNDYVDVPSSPSFNSAPFTIEAWVNPSQSRVQGVMYKKSSPGWRFFMAGSSGKIEFDVYPGEIANAQSASLTVGSWYHVVGTYDRIGVVKVYTNGVLNDTKTGISSMYNNNDNGIQIASPQTNRWNGSIDEVRIYSEALSLSEIQKHYAEGLEKHRLVDAKIYPVK